MNKDITVVIPAYNEENYIAETVNAILNWPFSAEIIIVDDGSTDNTNKIIVDLMETNKNIKLKTLQNNKGKGNALTEGLLLADRDIVFFLDADLGASAKEAIKLIYPILYENVDMTIAILPNSKTKAGLGLVKGLARKGIYHLTGFKSRAPLSGQRAIKRELLKETLEFAAGFGIEVGLTIDGLKKGWKIKEVEVSLRHRESKRDFNGFVHRGKEFIDVAKALYFRRRRIQL